MAYTNIQNVYVNGAQVCNIEVNGCTVYSNDSYTRCYYLSGAVDYGYICLKFPVMMYAVVQTSTSSYAACVGPYSCQSNGLIICSAYICSYDCKYGCELVGNVYNRNVKCKDAIALVYAMICCYYPRAVKGGSICIDSYTSGSSNWSCTGYSWWYPFLPICCGSSGACIGPACAGYCLIAYSYIRLGCCIIVSKNCCCELTSGTSTFSYCWNLSLRCEFSRTNPVLLWTCDISDNLRQLYVCSE